MLRSIFVKKVATSINKLMVECEKKGSVLAPEEFVNFLIDVFDELDILNPTHFKTNEEGDLVQVDGFEPEEVEDEV